MHCWGSGEHTGSEHVCRPADCTTALQNTTCQHGNRKNTFIIIRLSFTAFICHFQPIYCPLFLLIIILSNLNSYDSHPFFYFCIPPSLFFLDLTCFITIIPIICNDSYWLYGFLYFLLTHIRIDFDSLPKQFSNSVFKVAIFIYDLKNATMSSHTTHSSCIALCVYSVTL